MSMPNQTQVASFHIGTQPFSVEAKVEVTARGLLAITALVSGILLATALLVRAAKR
jgi:hypothetical protein